MSVFGEILRDIPAQNFGVEGIDVRIVPVEAGTLFFVSADRDVDFPAHKHGAQSSLVVSGECRLTIGGKTTTHSSGEMYTIPEGAEHSIRMSAGYAEIDFVADRTGDE